MNASTRRLWIGGMLAFLLSDRSPVPAITSQNFQTPGTPYIASACGTATAPVVLAGGPGGGNFIRLLAAADASSTNTIAFDRSDPGAFTQIIVDFDFRMTAGTGRGEGLGFVLLSTSAYNKTGGLCGAAEEPAFNGSLGVGFDIHQDAGPGDLNANHVSIHFNNVLLQQFDATPIVDLASGQWIHARITARPGGGFSDVTIVLTPSSTGVPATLVGNFAVPGLKPYEGRAYFAARSGVETADHDLANVQLQFTADPSVVGQWSAVSALPIVPIHSSYLPTGKIISWDRAWSGTDIQPRLIDPLTLATTLAAHPGVELFCSGHTLLPNGKLFVAGGHLVSDGNGLDTAFDYDPVTDVWTPYPNMNLGRWYPTVVLLGNGDALVVSGLSVPGSLNQVPQVMQFATGTWRNLTGAMRNLQLYPLLHLAPNGQVFLAGPDQGGGFLDTSGTGSWDLNINSIHGPRDYGCSVLYDEGKVLLVGGGFDPPTNTAEVIDLNAPLPAWRAVAPMSFARRQANALLLPDGKVLVTGGTNGPGFNDYAGHILAAELWDPVTETWELLSAMQVPRVYHSETVLLPDGRVLSLGGGHPEPTGGGSNSFSAEYYSPPYLFRGPRPSVTTSPATAAYGHTFPVGTPDAATVTAVTLIATTSVTHANNMSQRLLRPVFAAAGGGINVTVPSNPNVCPPGTYFLFLLNASGVPSVGKLIRIGPSLPPQAVPGPNITAEATGPGGASVMLDGTASTDPENSIALYEWFEGMTLLATGATATVTLPVGVHTITLKVTDAGTQTNSAPMTVTITDTTPPVIQTLTAAPDFLRTLSNQFNNVTLTATATDLVDPAPANQVLSVTSTEADQAVGPGDLFPDWQITGAMTVNLRSERFAIVRRYTITVRAADASTNNATRTVDVRVRGKWFP